MSPIRRWQRFAFLLALCGLVLVSTREIVAYGRLAAALSGGSLLERGSLGADEWRDFLNRSGRPDTQRAYHEAVKLGVVDRKVSGIASAWTWVVATGDRLPPDARVYLNLPNSVLYFFGTTAWYPRRIDVGRPGALVRDDDSLRAAFQRVEPGRYDELRARGFTHVVIFRNDRIVLVDLVGAAEPTRP